MLYAALFCERVVLFRIQTFSLSAMIRQLILHTIKVYRKYYTFYGNGRKYLKLHMEDDTMTTKGTSGSWMKDLQSIYSSAFGLQPGKEHYSENEILRYIQMYQEICK